MKTTLQLFCEALGWQGGTIHQAKDRFAIASLKEMDAICNHLMKNIQNCSDLETLQYFTNKRLEAIGLHSITL